MAEESTGKRVMVAIDESEHSHYALEWTLDNLIEKIKSSGLVLFTAVPIDYGGIYASPYGAAPIELITSMQEKQKNFAAALLEKAQQMCEKRGVHAETVSELGNPKDAICDAVEKFNIQLLVVGSHGKGAFQRAFLGSVSNYVVQNAKCPVLVVRKTV